VNEPDSLAEARRLDRGLQRLGIAADAAQHSALLAHLALIRRWSRSYNLVAPGDLPLLLERHLLDSLTVQPWLRPGAVLDVGSGAGFPGIPLAVINPGCALWLIDSAGKKARFLRHVARELGLENARVVHERVERFSPDADFSTIVSRAFSSLPTFVESVRHLARPETLLLAMKGRAPREELRALPAWARVEAVHRLEAPADFGERNLVALRVVPEGAET